MYAHLTEGTPLPPSQVVHTVPRGAGAPALTSTNVPAIAANPPAADRIRFGFDSALKKHVVLIPE
jgi:hydroxybutyrate-dimer hydrolase